MLILGDIRHVVNVCCDFGAVAAYADVDDQISKRRSFNGGLLVLGQSVLSKETYFDLLNASSPGHKMAEQDLLNDYFYESVTLLPKVFNFEKRITKGGKLKALEDGIKILHFVSDKPWDENREAGFEHYEKLWFNVYEKISDNRE